MNGKLNFIMEGQESVMTLLIRGDNPIAYEIWPPVRGATSLQLASTGDELNLVMAGQLQLCPLTRSW